MTFEALMKNTFSWFEPEEETPVDISTWQARLKVLSDFSNELRTVVPFAQPAPNLSEIFLHDGSSIWPDEHAFLTRATVQEILEADWHVDSSGIFDFKAPAGPAIMARFPENKEGFWGIGQVPTADGSWRPGITLMTVCPDKHENHFRASIY